jgi:aspartate/methionine/tyrosine aminotransferase
MDFLSVGGRSWEDLALSRDILHMGHNCNQLEIDPAINEAMISSIRNNEYRNYTPPYGFEELRDLIQKDLGLSSASILVTQGATDAIYQIMSAVLRPGDQVIVSDPAWPHIANFGRGLGAEVVDVPIYGAEAGYKLRIDLVERYITPRTKMIAVIDPLNPLGSSYSETEIRDLCRLAEQSGAYFLHDSTYRDFAEGHHFPAVNYYDRAAVAVSLSKTCGFAGLRVGAAIASGELFSRLTSNHVSRLGGNWVAQRGAIAAYRTKPKWLPRVLEVNRRHQAEIKNCIDTLKEFSPIVFPSAGNFLAIDVTGTRTTANTIVEAVLEFGIVIRSGNYTSKRFGDRFLRVTTTVPSDYVTRFCEVFPRAARAVSQAQSGSFTGS